MDSGQIVNHISTDAQNITMSVTFLHNAWSAPLMLLLALAMIVNELGIAAVFGFLVLLILVPVNYYLATKMGIYQKKGLGKDKKVYFLEMILTWFIRFYCC